jgi:two-component system, NarL family, response regulator NreC
MNSIRILLADDHNLFRQGVRSLLESEPGMEVVGEARDAGEAVKLAAETKPGLLLVDIGMPGMSSFEAVRQITRPPSETKAIFLTMYEDEDYLMESMQIGASGYVLKDSTASQLIAAVREVARGGTYLSSKMLSHLVDDFRSRARSSQRVLRFSTLTPREKEVLKLLAEGGSVKDIAQGLALSVKTVEAHKFNLMRKLGIHNKAQLVQYAIQKKMIRLPEMAQ